MEIINCTSTELLEKNIIKWDENQPLGGNDFCHYTNTTAMNGILESGSFWATRINNQNDTKEKKRYERKNQIFSLCFCNSNTEKIPMWYLYAGISGNGIRLRFTPSKMKAFIQGIKTIKPVYPNSSDDHSNLPFDLYLNDDFVISYGWIFYAKEDQHQIKHKGKWYNLIDEYELFEKDNYYIKDYPWEYEKEFRIVFDLSNYVKVHGPISFEKISIPFSREDVKLMFAPEITNKKQVLTQPGFQKYFASIVETSKLDISMGLLGKDINGMINLLYKAIDLCGDKTVYVQSIKELLNRIES